MDKAPPVVVARIWTNSEAAVIKSLLESYGIPCHHSSELPHRICPVTADSMGQIRIYVPSALEGEARAVLEDHRRRRCVSLRLVENQ